MNNSKFKEKVKQYTIFQQRHPKLFKLRVWFHLTLGAVYILALIPLELIMIVFFSISSFVSLIGLFLAIGSMVTFVMTLGIVLKIIFYNADLSIEDRLEEKDAPELFVMLRDMMKKLNCLQLEGVFIIHEQNAFVQQIPLFGILGGSTKNYLSIGAPLLYELDEKSLQGILAHELGHISAQHGKFSLWVARMDSIWSEAVPKAINKTFFGSSLFFYPYKWFLPRLRAMAYVFRRTNEYLADQMAAKHVDGQVFANGLALVNIASLLEEKTVLADYFALASTQSDVPSIYERYCKLFKENENDIPHFYKCLLNAKTGDFDSHPSFSDRVEAVHGLKYPISIPTELAYKVLLGEEGRRKIEESWRESIAIRWTYLREISVEKKKICRDFDNKHDLSQAEKNLWLECVMTCKGYNATVDLAKKIWDFDKSCEMANYYLGKHKLLYGEADGLELIMASVACNRTLLEQADEAVRQYFCLYSTHYEKDYELFRKKYEPVYIWFQKYSDYLEYTPNSPRLYTKDIGEELLADLKKAFPSRAIASAIIVKKNNYDNYPRNVHYILVHPKNRAKFRKEYNLLFSHIGCLEKKHACIIRLIDWKMDKPVSRIKLEMKGVPFMHTPLSFLLSLRNQ